jgi:hypothetical protein
MMSMTVAGGHKGTGARLTAAAIWASLGLLLLATGLTMLDKVAWGEASAHLAARNWPVADATVMSVSLDEIPGEGSAVPTLQLSVLYTFDLGDERIEGTRAGLSDVGDLHDRRLKALYGRLQFARVTGRTLPVFYDPAEPALAYLDTDFAWKDSFLNAGLGLALMVGGGAALATAMTPRTRRFKARP